MYSAVGADMTVNSVALAMIVFGGALYVVTMRFWKSAGEDPEVLAPLEVMGDRRFARADEDERTDLLNAVRPSGADHPEHIAAPPVLDHEPAQQERPWRDRLDHADDAVDVVPAQVIDPLLSRTISTDDSDTEDD